MIGGPKNKIIDVKVLYKIYVTCPYSNRRGEDVVEHYFPDNYKGIRKGIDAPEGL